MLDELLSWLSGLAAGATGLAPFAHTNLALEMAGAFEGRGGALFSSALSFSHAAFEAVPAVFFGLPAITYAAGVLPAHALALEGRGREALDLVLNSLLASSVAAVLLLPIALSLVPALYLLIKPVTPIALIALALAMAATEPALGAAVAGLFVFAASGALGVLSLSSPDTPGGALFALLTGLFGIPALLAAVGAVQPQQASGESGGVAPNWRLVLAGTFAGALSSLVPAVSGAMLSAVLFLVMETDPKAFLTVNSSLAGSRLLFDAVATQTIGKARSGSAAAVAEALGNADATGLALALLGGLAALWLAAMAARSLAGTFSNVLARKETRSAATLAVLATALLAVLASGGLAGLLIAATGGAVGALPLFLGVKRSHAMGCLVLPAALHGLLGPWELEALLLR